MGPDNDHSAVGEGASNALLSALIAAAVDGIITIDRRGVIETVNPAARRLFGYSSDEMVGRNVSRLMPEPFRSEHDSYLTNYLSTGTAQVIGMGREVVGRRKDGSTFPMHLSVGQAAVGEELHFIGIVRDISVIKEAEQARAVLI